MALIDFYHIVEALRRMSSYMTGGELQDDLDENDLSGSTKLWSYRKDHVFL